MPTAAGFAALFEVAAMSVALTIACIGGCRYTARCLRSSSPMHLSGLTASLLTVFFCIYGLTYWFNGTGGYSCPSFSTAMGTFVAASTAFSFVHLVMLSESLNQTSTRWKQFRLLGLVMTAIYCGSIVAVEVTRTAWEKGVGEGGSTPSSVACIGEGRCVTEVDDVALTVKWIAQLLNQIFQVAALFVPLRSRFEESGGSRFFSDIPRSTQDYGKGLIMPVWLFIISESVSVAMTTVVASLMLAKAQGRLESMPALAVEVLDNAANLVAVFFSADAIPLRKRPYDDPKDPEPRLPHASALSGSQPRSLSDALGESAASFGNDSSGGSQPLAETDRFVAHGLSAGRRPLSGNGSLGDNGGRLGHGSGYRIRRRPDGSLAGTYDGRGGYGLRGRMSTRGRNAGRLGIRGRRPRPHSIGAVSATPSFSSFASSSSSQRRYNSDTFVRRLPPLMDMSPEGHDKVDSSGHESRPGPGSHSRSPPSSSSRSSRSPPAGVPSPSSPPSGGAPSPARKEPTPIPVSPSTSATPPPLDGTAQAGAETAAEAGAEMAAEAVAARAKAARGSSSSGRQRRPLGALYFSSKSRLTRSGSSWEGDRSTARRTTMQNRAGLTRSRSGQGISAGRVSRAAAGPTASNRSLSAADLRGRVGVVGRGLDGGGNGGNGGATGVFAGGGGGGTDGGADQRDGSRHVDAHRSRAPSRSTRGLTSATPAAPQATGPEHLENDGGAVLANTRTAVALSPWKWQGREKQGQEQQVLPRPHPTNSNNNRRRPRGFNSGGTADGDGHAGREGARGGRGEARGVGTPASRTTEPHEITAAERDSEINAAGAAVAAALASSDAAISVGRRSSAVSRASLAGSVSDASEGVSPGAAAAAAVAAAHMVLWPLPLKDISSSDSASTALPNRRRRPRFGGLRSSSSSSSAAPSVPEEKQRGSGAVAAGPGWLRWQDGSNTTKEEATDGDEKTDPLRAAPVAIAAAAREGGLSSCFSGPATVDVGAALAAKAAGVAAAGSTAGAMAPLERRSSSSGTSRSGVSRVAWSAFSAASWCSSSFGGEENLKEGAPSSTVRSPASYFAGNCDDGR